MSRQSQALTGLLAQISQGAASVGIILAVRQYHGSLALAGAIVGAMWIAAAIGRPIQGRLMDRRGPAAVMAACGAVHAATLATIVGLLALGTPEPLLIVVGALAGLALPPVSTAMRVVWAADDDDRTAAYSKVYLVQELAILSGPLLVAALVASVSAAAAVVAVAAVSGVGALAFAWSVRGDRPAPQDGPRAAVLRVGAVWRLLGTAALVGALIGGIQIGAPAFAAAHGSPAASGLLLAAVSVGGIAGAWLYGRSRIRATPAARLVVLLAVLTVFVALTGSAGSFGLLAVLLIAAGFALNPSLSTFSLLVDQYVSRRSAAEAFGWLSTAIAVGTGAGSAIAAAVAQHHNDAGAAFVVAAVASGAAFVGAVLIRYASPVRSRSEQPSAS
jgi:predicted MFS family arabinose efflux permease